MLSSTSVSETARDDRPTRAAWMLLAGCLFVALSVEAAARVALDRSSKIQRRLVEEYQAARTIGADGRPADGHLLFVGNSLLDEGVDFERVQTRLSGWDTRRLMVENTYYYDWYYGLKRLYGEGARPDVVLIMLSVGQWMPATSRGDFSAQYLFSAADLPAVARDLDLHRTQATGLFAANFSKFWGARAEMRNFVIGHTMPGLGQLMAFVQPVNRRPIVDDDVERVVTPRLAHLKALTSDHSTELVILVPPMLDPSDGAAGLTRAALNAGVALLQPVVSGAFDATLYRDGFHLNPEGAEVFTDRLIEPLKHELGARVEERHTVASLERRE